MKFTFSVNFIVQILGVALQGANFFSGMVPAEYQPVLAAVVTIIQGVSALLAHFKNPDGTPAAVAYRPPALK
jgi:hypothetical protein